MKSLKDLIDAKRLVYSPNDIARVQRWYIHRTELSWRGTEKARCYNSSIWNKTNLIPLHCLQFYQLCFTVYTNMRPAARSYNKDMLPAWIIRRQTSLVSCWLTRSRGLVPPLLRSTHNNILQTNSIATSKLTRRNTRMQQNYHWPAIAQLIYKTNASKHVIWRRTHLAICRYALI